MGLLRSLCLCFSAKSETNGGNIDSGYTRIVEIKDAVSHSPRASRSIPVPHARRLNRHSLQRPSSPALLIDIDEKTPVTFEESLSSSRSSVISVPSTQISVLTSTNTGNTAPNRYSSESNFLGAPPSYHSRDAPSPCPSSRASFEHPVMTRDWLERLQNEAHRRYGPDATIPELAHRNITTDILRST